MKPEKGKHRVNSHGRDGNEEPHAGKAGAAADRAKQRINQEGEQEREIDRRTTHADCGLLPFDVKAVAVELVADGMIEPVQKIGNAGPRGVDEQWCRDNGGAPERCPDQERSVDPSCALLMMNFVISPDHVG